MHLHLVLLLVNGTAETATALWEGASVGLQLLVHVFGEWLALKRIWEKDSLEFAEHGKGNESDDDGNITNTLTSCDV